MWLSSKEHNFFRYTYFLRWWLSSKFCMVWLMGFVSQCSWRLYGAGSSREGWFMIFEEREMKKTDRLTLNAHYKTSPITLHHIFLLSPSISHLPSRPLWFCISFFLTSPPSLYFSPYFFLLLSFITLIYRSIHLSIYLSIHPSILLSIYLSIYLPIYRSIYLSIYLSCYLSIYLSIYVSLYLSIFLSLSFFSRLLLIY